MPLKVLYMRERLVVAVLGYLKQFGSIVMDRVILTVMHFAG